MALTLVKEDGTGKVDANSYADAADGDAYHDGHLYASAWTAASAGNKDKALVMATRLIDAEYQFNGFRTNDGQALQWPRERCPDPDSGGTVGLSLLLNYARYLDNDKVPAALANATCELARELLIADRTTGPRGEGLKYENTGTTQVGYSKTDVPPVIPHVVQSMLSKYGSLLNGRSGSVRLTRG
jgi:hypothetical protein